MGIYMCINMDKCIYRLNMGSCNNALDEFERKMLEMQNRYNENVNYNSGSKGESR
jgi:hypothetical protein